MRSHPRVPKRMKVTSNRALRHCSSTSRPRCQPTNLLSRLLLPRGHLTPATLRSFHIPMIKMATQCSGPRNLVISVGKWAWTASFPKEGNWYMAAPAVSDSPMPSHRAASDLRERYITLQRVFFHPPERARWLHEYFPRHNRRCHGM
jgi:hypothetical protein